MSVALKLLHEGEMPKDTLMNANEMATYYKKTKEAFLQAWRRDKKKPRRLIPDPINEGCKDLLWRVSDVDRFIAKR